MNSLLSRTFSSRGQLLTRRVMARQQGMAFSTYQLDHSPSISTSSSSPYADTVFPAGKFIAPVSEREMIRDQPWVQIFAGGVIAFVGLMWLGEIDEATSKQAHNDHDVASDDAGDPTRPGQQQRSEGHFRTF